MTSQRPYLLRALYEWIADNGLTPHVVVDARVAGVRVPAHTVKDGQVVLNIAERAVAKLELGNDFLRFSARFGGVSQTVMVPVDAVIAIYARETGQGMALPPADAHAGAADAAPATAPTAVPDVSTTDAQTPQPDVDAPATGDEPPKRGGHLRIVK